MPNNLQFLIKKISWKNNKWVCSIASKTRRNQLCDLPIYNLKYIVTEAEFYAKISFYALLS